jgi:hypothetical protein
VGKGRGDELDDDDGDELKSHVWSRDSGGKSRMVL